MPKKDKRHGEGFETRAIHAGRDFVGETGAVDFAEMRHWLEATIDRTERVPQRKDNGGIRVLDMMQLRGVTCRHLFLVFRPDHRETTHYYGRGISCRLDNVDRIRGNERCIFHCHRVYVFGTCAD